MSEQVLKWKRNGEESYKNDHTDRNAWSPRRNINEF